jgi:hypothetical protein
MRAPFVGVEETVEPAVVWVGVAAAGLVAVPVGVAAAGLVAVRVGVVAAAGLVALPAAVDDAVGVPGELVGTEDRDDAVDALVPVRVAVGEGLLELPQPASTTATARAAGNLTPANRGLTERPLAAVSRARDAVWRVKATIAAARQRFLLMGGHRLGSCRFAVINVGPLRRRGIVPSRSAGSLPFRRPR